MNQDNKNPLFYTLWAAAILLCTVLSVFSLLFASCSHQERKKSGESASSGFTVESEELFADATEAGSDEGESADAVPAVSSVRLPESADAGREYLDKFIFLGDSTTYGIGAYYNMGYEELCPPSQIWTPANGTLTLSYYSIATVVYPETGEEIPIAEALSRAKPEYLLVTLGVNGISFMDEDWFIRDYSALVKLLQEASPDTKIILNSIYPCASSYPYQNDININKINAANSWIERIAADTGVRFLYSFECLVGADGYLPEADQNGDGIHLTGEAFTKVMQYIRTHAYQ